MKSKFSRSYIVVWGPDGNYLENEENLGETVSFDIADLDPGTVIKLSPPESDQVTDSQRRIT